MLPQGLGFDPARLSDDQKALAAFGAAVVPALLGITLPGGYVRDRVDLDLIDVFVATLPWTASIALIVWLLQAAPDDWNELATAAGCVAILGFGAAIGVELVPAQAVVTEEQADQIPFYILAEQQGAVARGGVIVSHSPRASAAIALLGIVAFVTVVYAVLYGVALWLAGIVCGTYLGMLLHRAFTDPAQSRDDRPAPDSQFDRDP